MAPPDHRRLQRAALDVEATAQLALFAGDCNEARRAFAEASNLYRESYELAPPDATGRLIGMLKASVLAGSGPGERAAAAYTRAQLAAQPPQPDEAYALAVSDLIEERDADVPARAGAMRTGTPPFGRAATALEAIADRRPPVYGRAVEAIVRDFEARRHHVTRVPIADTALVLEVFAERRGMAASPQSPLVPGPCPGRTGGDPSERERSHHGVI